MAVERLWPFLTHLTFAFSGRWTKRPRRGTRFNIPQLLMLSCLVLRLALRSLMKQWSQVQHPWKLLKRLENASNEAFPSPMHPLVHRRCRWSNRIRWSLARRLIKVAEKALPLAFPQSRRVRLRPVNQSALPSVTPATNGAASELRAVNLSRLLGVSRIQQALMDVPKLRVPARRTLSLELPKSQSTLAVVRTMRI